MTFTNVLLIIVILLLWNIFEVVAGILGWSIDETKPEAVAGIANVTKRIGWTWLISVVLLVSYAVFSLL